MLRLSVASLVLLGAATSVVANPSPAPEPFFLDGLKDRLADLKDHLTETAHNLLGQKSCPIPALLPAACKGTVSIAESRKNLDECCSEIPGGRILLTQFYNAQPSFGPEKEWTIHGLWPDNCDGSWEQYCDVEREYDNIREILTQGGRTDLLEYMDRMWKSNTGNDQSLWSHEWNKHGTCMSTLNPECYGKAYKQYDEVVDYFEKTVSQDKKLPTYEWLEAAGIVPSETATYTLEQLQAVAKKNHGYEAIWGCNNKNELDEVWYQYIARGPIAGGKLIPAVPAGSPSSCPATGIKYLPKTGSNNGGSDGGSNNGGGSDNGSTGEVAAKVFWNVEREGNQEGCLISKGTWYTTGTCATYYLYPVDESVTTIAAGVEFTMTSSKGPCSLDTNSQLVCASGNTASTFSVDADNSLTSAGSPAWYAAQVASGSTQVNVATEENTVALTIKMGSPQ
ncbi:hypothetical protein JCM6882_001843 [Rhodosporidiobolus microsporus]